MKKSKVTIAPVEITGTKSEIDQPTRFSAEPPPIAFGDHTVWIGGQALKRLAEQTEEQYPDDVSDEGPEGYPTAGLRQVTEVLMQFQDVMGVRLRLIFGTPDKPLHELDVSDVPTSQGQLENDDIQKWIHAGASLIADARDLT